MPGSSLLSHGETPHYHRRYNVSLLSSAWDQVGPLRYGRQAEFFKFFNYSSLPETHPFGASAPHCSSLFQTNWSILLPASFLSVSRQQYSILNKLTSFIFVSQTKHLRCCQVKPHGSLVLVSSTYRYAYTPSLSTS